MLRDDEIEKIVREIAKVNLKPRNFARVFVEPTTDSVGNDALRITIVIKPGAVGRIEGDAPLDTLVQIQNRLSQAGDSRFPIIEYATEEELNSVGDS